MYKATEEPPRGSGGRILVLALPPGARPKTNHPIKEEKEDMEYRNYSWAAQRLLGKLDRMALDPSEAADKRRVLREEAIALRAVLNADLYYRRQADIETAIAEAERVLTMWEKY